MTESEDGGDKERKGEDPADMQIMNTFAVEELSKTKDYNPNCFIMSPNKDRIGDNGKEKRKYEIKVVAFFINDVN